MKGEEGRTKKCHFGGDVIFEWSQIFIKGSMERLCESLREYRRLLGEFGRVWESLEKIWKVLGEIGRVWESFGEFWPSLGEFWRV